MTPAERLLEEMRRRGVQLSANGDHLEVRGLLSDEDVERLERDKAGLLELLRPARSQPRRPVRVTRSPARAGTTRVSVVGNPASDLYEDLELDVDRVASAPKVKPHQPNVRRQAAVRAAGRDDSGRFLARGRQQDAEQLLAELWEAGLWVWQRDGRLRMEVAEGRELSREEVRRLEQLAHEREAELLTVAPPGQGWVHRIMYGDAPAHRPGPGDRSHE